MPRSSTPNRRAFLVLLGIALIPRPAAAAPIVLDSFDNLNGWTTVASEGSRVSISKDSGRMGSAMRIDYQVANGGWVIVRKNFSLVLPENYAFMFDVRGTGPRNNFEFKLDDLGDKGVWWRRQHDFTFPADWQRITLRKSRIEHAWGSDPDLKRVGAIEFALSSGEGGSGSLWIEDLAFEQREPAATDGSPPQVRASTSLAGSDPQAMVDGNPATSWKSEPSPEEQWVQLDFARNREYGGLAIDWDADDFASAFDVEVSSDGNAWTGVYSTTTSRGKRSYIYMPDAESRFVRLALHRASRGRGYGIDEVTVEPVEFSASREHFLEAIARDAEPGTYPKYFSGRQTYWTIVGVSGGGHTALMNEEGMVEVDKGSFSIEPFLFTGGRLVTWHDVAIEQSLAEGSLPIPSVTRHDDALSLTITALAAGPAGASTLYLRYRVKNLTDRETDATLFAAIRPFQVLPPWQSLNIVGGPTRIHEVRLDGDVVWVDRDKAIVPLTRPDRFGAATFEEGQITDFLAAGTVPPYAEVTDNFGFASGVLAYDLHVAPHGEAEVVLAAPFEDPQAAITRAAVDGAPPADRNPAVFAEHHRDAEGFWQDALGRIAITLPPEEKALVDTLRSSIAYILVERDGPALRPGTRTYGRSWIRDGAMMSTSLLEMGFRDEVRDFIRWFAGYQEADGRVPCCVNAHGPEAVPENDSPGAFLYAIMEHYRFTHDAAFLAEMWPHAVRAVDYLSALRARRMTDEFRAEDKVQFYGLLPESISHEGYSGHPVHAYWDDFFALRGLKDAADMAVVVGDSERSAAYAKLRDDFRITLLASIGKAMSMHGIDYIPGSVELGDFDPTSTGIAVEPGGELANLPEPALTRTFDRYLESVDQRLSPGSTQDGYSAYELRNVGTLLRMGRKQRAIDLLRSIFADRRPPPWNEWAEISWRDSSAPRFIGDMPHGWVASGFVGALRDLLVYERESDHSLVLAAGIPEAWVTSGPGVSVKQLPTYYGPLSYTLRSGEQGTLHLELAAGLTLPEGKIILESPFPRPIRSVTINGKPTDDFTAERAVIGECPADVVLRYE